MSTKFTPGPWEDKGHDCKRFQIESRTSSRALLQWRKENPDKKQDAFNGVTVCRLGVHWNGSGEEFGPSQLIDEDEVSANAALIAAAPDLYAAVEMLLDEVRILSHYGGLGDERQIGVGQSRIELARSILKKAGGG